MDRDCKSGHCQVWLGWVFILSPSARTGLADLAPWAKVVQTVGCSTFTHGAKPATRRVADGERMNPQGGMASPRQYRGDVEHQGDEHLESGPGEGSRPRAPRVWLRSPRFFTPYRPTRTRQDLPCTGAGDPAPHGWRAINVPLAPVMSGLSRSLAATFQGRSGRY